MSSRLPHGAALRRHRLLPSALGLAAVVVAIGLWFALVHVEHGQMRRAIAAQAASVRLAILERASVGAGALQRMAAAWGRTRTPSRESWDADAMQAIEFGGYQSVQWVDTTLSIRWAVPSSNEAGSASMADRPEWMAALREARATRRPLRSAALELARGGTGFLTIVPIFRGEQLQGFIVGESRTDVLVDPLQKSGAFEGYSVSIFSGVRETYARLTDGRQNEMAWHHDLPLGDDGAWRVRVWPTSEELERQSSPLPEAALCIGLLLAAVLVWSVRLQQTALARALDLGDAKSRLKREIGERERAQEALRVSEDYLRQAQKMEAVGRLAGGIAHDFNNILTAITGYADFLLADIDRADPRRDDVREIKKAALRAASLTSQLLAFSRRQIRQPRLLDLNIVLTEIEKILGRLIGEDVVLRTSLAESLGSIKADAGQIEQILLNLVVNASDAMPNGGTIAMTTSNVAVNRVLGEKHSQLDPGSYVMLRVSDTGCGMDAATQARIFEPFFTTKGPGKGTGLGLSTVYAVVEQSGGTITVESEVGRGTTFTVFLPRCDEPAEAYSSGIFAPPSPRGAETVLLVEDEDGVRALAGRILERHGYSVLEAKDGRDALMVAAQHSGSIDLLLTDVVMPSMGGKQLAETIVARAPRVRVLYMSGHTDGEISRRGELHAGTAFLQKPFSADALLGKVREVLDGRALAA